MRAHNRLSIRQKIIFIILAITIVSIITGFTIEIFNSIKTSRNELTNNIMLDAKLIADYILPTFLFDDQSGAKDILLKLSNIPTVIYGAAYDPNGTIYAEYCSSASVDSSKSLPEILKSSENRNEIFITEPVWSKDEVLGTVLLIASTDIIREKTRDHIESVLIILSISILIAILLAFWLERIISGPILHLAAATRIIQETSDYSVRVKKESNDETGILYDGFNDMLQSIDERKKERDIAEKRLREERENLEIRVIERTEELNTAKEKAEESDRLKSSFLANMSHEIRTPLNAILGFSALLMESSASEEEKKEYYQMMDSSGKDLINLIDDILDLSLIEANQVKITFADIHVNELMEEIFGIFKQSLTIANPESTVSPVLDIPNPDVNYVLNTDRLRLKQVLINILNNSIKFTHVGNITFGYVIENEKDNIIFYIKDSGIGIPKDKIDKIFERFTKVADIKTKHYRGTGLGLSIAMKLTNMLNGKIWVDSELNKGSVFYISFPFSRYVSSGVAVSSDSSPALVQNYINKTILVVEDVEWNFKYFEVLLTKYTGAKVFWAKDGFEAVEFCKNNPETNLVLMDIQLPDMDGHEATRHIRLFNSNLPIIAQTAYTSPATIEACYSSGCDDIIIKPVEKSVLFKIIAKWIK